MDLGCHELSLGDTIGVGTTGHVHRLLEALGARGIGTDRVAVHFHDTYGQALANTMAALRDGVSVVDAAAGGLGGCPYAKSATGNLATEDLVWALHGAGVETGVDLDALVETSVWMARQLGRPVAEQRRARPRRRLSGPTGRNEAVLGRWRGFRPSLRPRCPSGGGLVLGEVEQPVAVGADQGVAAWRRSRPWSTKTIRRSSRDSSSHQPVSATDLCSSV